MQLGRLQMRNFRRYRDQDVHFRDGITGIVGNNGTGKSTIVDAILFCLFGVKETGLDFILSAGAGARDRAEVRLDFSVRGEAFQLVRTLDRRKKHDAELYREGKLFADGVSDVQAAVRRIIRMGYADFRHTIFSGQRELLILVEAKPEERKRWFRRVLGIDSLKDEGGEILRGEAEEARQKILLIEGRLEGASRDDLESRLGETERQIANADLEIAELGEEEKRLAGARVSLQEEAKIQRDRERQDHGARSLIRAGEGEAGELAKELEKVRATLARLRVTGKEFEHLRTLEDEFPLHQERYNASMEKYRTMRELAVREKEKEERIAGGKEELTRLRDEETRLARDEEEIRALAPLVARRQEVSGRLNGLKHLEERYRKLGADLGRRQATLEALAKRGESLRTRIERMKEAQGRLISLARGAGVPPDRERDPVPALEERRGGILRRISDREAGRDQMSGRLLELEANLSALAAGGPEGTCPTCRQPLGEQYPALVADIERDIRALQEARESQESDLRKAEGDLRALQSLLNEARKLMDECRGLGEDSADWSRIQEEAIQEIAAKEQLQQEMENLGYDPMAREKLEEEYTSLEDPWKASIRAAERLKGKEGVSRKIEDLGKNLEKIEAEIQGIARAREELRFDTDLHQGIEKEYREAEQAHHRFLELRPGMDQVPVLLGKEKDLNARASSVGQTLMNLRSELATIAFSPEELRQAEFRLEENSRHAQEQNRRLERAMAGKASIEQEKVRLHDALGRLTKDTRERDRLSELVQLLELTRDHLNGFTDHLLGVVRDRIEDEAGRILSEITDGRYDTVTISDDFEILVHDLGGDYPVARFSGGEQDDVAIALRVALSRYIAEMHELHDSAFLVFDEIFGSQDEERRSNIFRALRNMEPYFPQIFLISHVSEVQGEFGNTLLVEAVSGSESRVRDTGEAGE